MAIEIIALVAFTLLMLYLGFRAGGFVGDRVIAWRLGRELPSRVPEHFSIETCAADFAGNKRKIKVESDDREPYKFHRMCIMTQNGWGFSCIWGFGAYCSTAREESGGLVSEPPPVAPNAEIGVFPKNGRLIQLNGDTVAGWVTPEQLVRALAAAERNDVKGIQAALTHSVKRLRV